jgi:diadenosine tetraphosphate (Ap4A) HIT family hydrolase
MTSEAQGDCIFCGILRDDEGRVWLSSDKFFVMYDKYPVNSGHSLIIPHRHQADIFSLNAREWQDLQKVIMDVKQKLDEVWKPAGYNIGINCGADAGQTVFHLHVHVIPRYENDVPNPHGGIRNFKKSLVPYGDPTTEAH